MTRFGLAIALIIGVFVALYVAPAFAQLAHQIDRYDVAAAGDHKISHATNPASEGQQDHA